MSSEIIEIKQAEMLSAINRSEVDIQIATAKQYPRNLPEVLNKIATYATMDAETAEDCFYVLRRSGSTIEGLSVRMAEIIAGAWGNLRVQTRIIGNDGKTITAQGICHDLETNYAASVEVKRKITDKYGKTFSEDMQVVTGNAASAIAYRNAVLKVVPKAVTKRVIEEVKKVAIGQSLDLETSRQNMIQYFAGCGKEIYAHKKMDHFNRVISLARYINRDITQIPVSVRGVLVTIGYASWENLINQQMKKILDLSDRVDKISEILKTTPDLEPSFLDHDYDDDDDMDEDDEIDD